MSTPTHPSAAQPTRKIFDPWNSSSTGHQRAENRLSGSTSWRASRSAKLAVQFRSGPGGGRRMYDSVGAGSRDFGKDGRKENGGWEKGATGLREKGWQDVRGLLDKKEDQGKSQPAPTTQQTSSSNPKNVGGNIVHAENPRVDRAAAEEEEKKKDRKPSPQRGIFAGLCIYINGSTAPMVGDHKLKQLLAENGARISIALGRRSVTHVILGTPNNGGGRGGGGGTKGAGGGLAAGKIQKEIQRIGGKGVKFVGVEWVLQSLAAGKRLPEPRFSNLALAPKSQKSVYGMFTKNSESGTKGVPD